MTFIPWGRLHFYFFPYWNNLKAQHLLFLILSSWDSRSWEVLKSWIQVKPRRCCCPGRVKTLAGEWLSPAEENNTQKKWIKPRTGKNLQPWSHKKKSFWVLSKYFPRNQSINFQLSTTDVCGKWNTANISRRQSPPQLLLILMRQQWKGEALAASMVFLHPSMKYSRAFVTSTSLCWHSTLQHFSFLHNFFFLIRWITVSNDLISLHFM